MELDHSWWWFRDNGISLLLAVCCLECRSRTSRKYFLFAPWSVIRAYMLLPALLIQPSKYKVSWFWSLSFLKRFFWAEQILFSFFSGRGSTGKLVWRRSLGSFGGLRRHWSRFRKTRVFQESAAGEKLDSAVWPRAVWGLGSRGLGLSQKQGKLNQQGFTESLNQWWSARESITRGGGEFWSGVQGFCVFHLST